MSSGVRKAALLLLLLMSSFCLIRHSEGQAQPPSPLKALPSPPAVAPPSVAEQAPPRAPIVAYQNDQLTILADNATLSSILQLVRDRTGALLDLPAGAEERVFGRFGPGPVRDVLAALLNGSRFNYVMLGSAENPDGLTQIILSSRPPDPVVNNPPVQQMASLAPEPAEAETPPQNTQQEGDRIAAEEQMRQQRSLQLLQNLEERQRALQPQN